MFFFQKKFNEKKESRTSKQFVVSFRDVSTINCKGNGGRPLLAACEIKHALGGPTLPLKCAQRRGVAAPPRLVRMQPLGAPSLSIDLSAVIGRGPACC